MDTGFLFIGVVLFNIRVYSTKCVRPAVRILANMSVEARDFLLDTSVSVMGIYLPMIVLELALIKYDKS